PDGDLVRRQAKLPEQGGPVVVLTPIHEQPIARVHDYAEGDLDFSARGCNLSFGRSERAGVGATGDDLGERVFAGVDEQPHVLRQVRKGSDENAAVGAPLVTTVHRVAATHIEEFEL